MLTTLLLFLTISLIIIATMSIYSFYIGAPILFSPKKATEESLRICQTKPGEKFYDLGAGTGRSMLIASKKFELDTYGFELSPAFAFIAKYNLWINNAKNSTIYLKNFYNANLNDADIIFCFLTPKAMLRLKNKFKTELRPGTRIISYAFNIPGWSPEKVINNSYPGKIFYYIKK
jgi:SAM-dependent methyltransferase